MPFQAVSQDRLYERVARQVADLVTRGELKPGERLPAERDLAKRLAVSRPTVREAMVALEIAGLVEVRTGAGIFVRERNFDGMSTITFDAGQGPFDLLVARQMIEPEIAALAAPLAGHEDLTALERTIDALAEATNYRASLHSDRAFHIGIARITGNTVLVSIIEGLWNILISPIFDVLAIRTGLPDRGRMTVQDHRAIVAALRARDAEGAREAMRTHLQHVEAILSTVDATVEEVA